MHTQTSRHSRNTGARRRSRSFSSSRTGASRTEFSRDRRHRPPRGTQRNNRTKSGRILPTFDPSQFINKNPAQTEVTVFTPKHTFNTFGLDPRLAGTITELGITSPSPIQDEIIPHILNGRDVIGLAETGTGKTAAFLAPLIHKTLSEYNRITLVLTPTRELALQIEAELKKLSRGLRMHSTVCVGGTSIAPQIRALRNRNHFIIGTPGRILDLMERGRLPMDRITTVVLDEADRMLDMGFINDMRTILSATPKDRETLFFSATMTKAAEALVHEFLHNPVTVSVKKQDVTQSVIQDVVRYEHHAKFDTLTSLLKNQECTRVIIFGAMKHSVEKLAQELTRHGIKAESIHGNKNHNQRQRALQAFKQGRVHVLVATDVAARGIHVDDVSHVINYDLPGTFEDYVHRIGRTGRGLKRGKALTFVEKH